MEQQVAFREPTLFDTMGREQSSAVMSIWPGSDGWTPPGHRLVIELRARCGIAIGQIETPDYRVADRRFDVAAVRIVGITG